MEGLDKLKKMIGESRRIAFLGGAGVSTESGIPDFRSENGIFAALRQYGQPPEVLLSHDYFLRHTDLFFDYYKSSLLVTDVEPNPAHYALAKLEAEGKLTAVVTQNIDGLHQKAGSRNVYELHGSIYRNSCMGCAKHFSADYVAKCEGAPRCDACGAIVKPDVVLYGEGLEQDVLAGAVSHISRADMLIVGGTSLSVYPAAGLIEYYGGSRLVLINKSETPYDSRASLVIHEAIGKVLAEAVGL